MPPVSCHAFQKQCAYVRRFSQPPSHIGVLFSVFLTNSTVNVGKGSAGPMYTVAVTSNYHARLKAK